MALSANSCFSNFRIPPFHTDSHPCIRIGGPVAYIDCFPEHLDRAQGYGTTNIGYGTTNADAGVRIGIKRGIQKFDKKLLISR